MKRLRRYISGMLASAIGLALLVWTFVLVSGNLMQAFDLLARGMHASTVFAFIAYLLPYMLQYTIPLSVLCGTVHVFNKLSGLQEINAMRSAGISLWQIITPAVFAGLTATLACLYLQLQLTPEAHHRADMLKQSQQRRNPLIFLDSDSGIRFEQGTIYVGKRDGNAIEHVQIYKVDENRVQDIYAKRGTVKANETEGELLLTLQDVRIANTYKTEKRFKKKSQETLAKQIRFPISYTRNSDHESLVRDVEYMTMMGLLARIQLDNQYGADTTELIFELNKRFALAFSPFSLLLMGIPFAIQTKRNETTAGIAISIFLAMFFYLFLALAESFDDKANYHPELVVWLPNLLYQAGGLYGLHRLSRK